MVHSFAYNKKGELRGNFVPLLGSWLAGWLATVSVSLGPIHHTLQIYFKRFARLRFRKGCPSSGLAVKFA